MVYIVNLVLIIFLQIISVINSIKVLHGTENTLFANREFNSEILKTDFKKSILRCAAVCLNTEHCVSIYYNKRLQQCKMYPFVFSNNAVTQPSSQTGWKYYHTCSDECPIANGYIYDATLKLCVKVHNPPKNYQNALSACRNDGDELLRVDSVAIQNAIKVILASEPGESYYVQGYKDSQAGMWRYNDGSPFIYMNFDFGEPEATDKYLDLWRISSFRWHGVSGDISYGYICQKCIRS